MNVRVLGTSVVMFGSLLGGCDRDRDDSHQRTSDDPMLKAPTAPVSSVVHDPNWYRGKTVRLSGEVETVHHSRAFTMEGDAIWWPHDIIVLTKRPVDFAGIPLDDDAQVMVTGHVVVGPEEVERELGPREAGTPPIPRREGVLIAREIRLVGEYGSWSLAESQPTSLGMLGLLTSADPQALDGKPVVIAAAKVRSVGDRAVWVGPKRSKQVLVVPSDPRMASGLRIGMTVSIRGTARVLPPVEEAIRTLGLEASSRRQIADTRLYVDATEIKPKSEPTALLQ